MRRSQAALQLPSIFGWVTEWSIVHAWKACVPKGTEGSNPSPSATDWTRFNRAANWARCVRTMEIRTPLDQWSVLQREGATCSG